MTISIIYLREIIIGFQVWIATVYLKTFSPLKRHSDETKTLLSFLWYFGNIKQIQEFGEGSL